MTLFANAIIRDGKVELKDSIEIDLNKMPSSDPIAFSYGYFRGRSYKENPNVAETFKVVHGANYRELSQEYLRGYLLGRKGILIKEGIKIKKGQESNSYFWDQNMLSKITTP